MLTRILYTPSVCPLTTDELCDYARLDDPSQLAILGLYGLAATEYVENYCNRFLLEREITWVCARDEHQVIENRYGYLSLPFAYDGGFGTGVGGGLGWGMFWQRWLRLPRPASAVSSVILTDWDGNQTPLTLGSDYSLDLGTEPGRVRINLGTYAPCTANMQVTMTTGYGATAATIPAPIKLAVGMLAANLYTYRGEEGSSGLTTTVHALLAPYSFHSFG